MTCTWLVPINRVFFQNVYDILKSHCISTLKSLYQPQRWVCVILSNSAEWQEWVLVQAWVLFMCVMLTGETVCVYAHRHEQMCVCNSSSELCLLLLILFKFNKLSTNANQNSSNIRLPLCFCLNILWIIFYSSPLLCKLTQTNLYLTPLLFCLFSARQTILD